MTAKTSPSSVRGQHPTFRPLRSDARSFHPEPEPPFLAGGGAAAASSSTSSSSPARRSAQYPPLPAAPSSTAPLLPPSTAAGGGAAASSSPAASSWESLRKRARKLENEVDFKLAAFARAGASSAQRHNNSRLLDDPRGGDVGAADAAEAEVEELLRRARCLQQTGWEGGSRRKNFSTVPNVRGLSNVVTEMATYLDGAAGAQANPSMNHLLQRHRDVLFDYTREFKKTKANIRSSREHAELLRTVQEDISSYHTGASSSQDMLLTERGRIDNSHRMANQILEQANETKDSLGKQRGMLAGMNRRIALTASQIPGLNSVIGKIGRRKRRDSVILAGVISFCLFLLLMYIT